MPSAKTMPSDSKQRFDAFWSDRAAARAGLDHYAPLNSGPPSKRPRKADLKATDLKANDWESADDSDLDPDTPYPQPEHGIDAFTSRQSSHLKQAIDLRATPELNKFVLIELFGGIAPLRFAFQGNDFLPAVHIYAGRDPTAAAVTRYRFPETSVWKTLGWLTPEIAVDVSREVIPVSGGQSSSCPLEILIGGGPPCKDYTRVKGNEAQGDHGKHGAKLKLTFEWIRQFRILAKPLGWIIRAVVETVVPYGRVLAQDVHEAAIGGGSIQEAGSEHIELLGRATWIDLADFGDTAYPILKADSVVQLVPEQVFDGDWELHGSIQDRSTTLGCFLTPSIAADGRPLPPGRRESDFPKEIIERWRADKRRFSQWSYQDSNLAWNGSGSWTPLTPVMKEIVHGYPPGYTERGERWTGGELRGYSIEDLTRSRLVSNSWHLDPTFLIADSFQNEYLKREQDRILFPEKLEQDKRDQDEYLKRVQGFAGHVDDRTGEQRQADIAKWLPPPQGEAQRSTP